MTNQNKPTPEKKTERAPIDWRTRAYMTWTLAGMLFGVLSGYMYTRAAKEHANRSGGKPPEPGTMELMGLILAAMAMVRQVAELGKPENDKDRKK